jgi:hypothetical protein
MRRIYRSKYVCPFLKFQGLHTLKYLAVVFAISTFLLSRSQSPDSEFRRASDKLHAAAQPYVNSIFTSHNAIGLQGVLLLAHYSFFNPECGSRFRLRCYRDRNVRVSDSGLTCMVPGRPCPTHVRRFRFAPGGAE